MIVFTNIVINYLSDYQNMLEKWCATFTGEKLRVVRSSGQQAVDAAVCTAKKAFADWSQVPAFERGQVLTRAARLIRVSGFW